MPIRYLFKYQYFSEKRSVRKWTLCPFSDTKADINLDLSVFICIVLD